MKIIEMVYVYIHIRIHIHTRHTRTYLTSHTSILLPFFFCLRYIDVKRGDWEYRDLAQTHWQQNRNKTLLPCYFIWSLIRTFLLERAGGVGDVRRLGGEGEKRSRVPSTPFLCFLSFIHLV